MADIILHGLTKRFGAVTAVDDLSLSIKSGELIVLLGPTGVGKTTTLRLVAGLEAPDMGTVEIGGVDVTGAAPASRNVAFVFQQYSLYPHLSVYDNLAFPLRAPVRRLSEDAIRTRVMEVAKLLRIDDKLANSATKLSGGQMQRVAIGRALVRDPAVFLMDEPLSSLDAKLRSELRLELKHIQTDLGATILYVTHDQIEAMTMGTRVGVMEAGRLVQVGTPREIYDNPASVHVATRLGQPAINLIPRASWPGAGIPAATATIGVRTEHIAVRPENGAGEGLGRGTIKWIEHLGDQNHLHIDTPAGELVTLADPDAPFDVGAAVTIDFVAPHFFDAAGQRIRT